MVRLSLAFALLLRTVVAPPPCANKGELAKDCGAGKGNPKGCCAGLVCSDSDTTCGGGACPSEIFIDCISWSEEGGNCQALHAIVRVRDDAGNPVNGANVLVKTNQVVSGDKSGIRTTSASLSTNYQGEISSFCPPDDPLPFEGTTAAYCWQQWSVGTKYNIEVIDVDWPDCPSPSRDFSPL